MHAKHTRPAILIAVAASSALVVSGCAGDTAPGPDLDLDLSGTTLVVAADWSGTEQANFETVLDAFEQRTGAEVQYTGLGNNVATILGSQIEGGSPPDVALIPQPGLLTQFAADGHLIPLSDDARALVEQNYSQSWIDLGSHDGTLYGVWFKGANKSTVWYNADIYAEVGAVEPATWEDFLAQLRLIGDSGYYGLSVGADVGWPLTDWFENVYLRTAGGEKYDQLAAHEIPWTDPSVTEALEILAELWSDRTIMQPGAAQRGFSATVPEVFGSDPSAATVYEGDFMAGIISTETSSVVGTDALFYDFPSINGSAPAVVGGGNAAVAFTDTPGTDALMQFLASPEAAEIWVQLGGFSSPNTGVDLSLYPDDISRSIAEALATAETFRFDLSDLAPSAFGGTEGTGMWQILIDFLNDPSDIQGTQEALEASAQAAYGN